MSVVLSPHLAVCPAADVAYIHERLRKYVSRAEAYSEAAGTRLQFVLLDMSPVTHLDTTGGLWVAPTSVCCGSHPRVCALCAPKSCVGLLSLWRLAPVMPCSIQTRLTAVAASCVSRPATDWQHTSFLIVFLLVLLQVPRCWRRCMMSCSSKTCSWAFATQVRHVKLLRVLLPSVNHCWQAGMGRALDPPFHPAVILPSNLLTTQPAACADLLACLCRHQRLPWSRCWSAQASRTSWAASGSLCACMTRCRPAWQP